LVWVVVTSFDCRNDGWHFLFAWFMILAGGCDCLSGWDGRSQSALCTPERMAVFLMAVVAQLHLVTHCEYHVWDDFMEPILMLV
jgi:hypothetical protein